MLRRKLFRLRLRSQTLELGGRTLIMGVLNVTSDSFSGDGRRDLQSAVSLGLELADQGADILDVGGESTRPGAISISAREELARVVPVLEALRGKLRIPISVDTRKAAVAEAALSAGAEIINDVSALSSDARMAEVACEGNAAIILMHMRGTPRTMQKNRFAANVMREVSSGLRRAIARARHMGVRKSQLLIDPGIGFGKTYEQNFELLARLPEFAGLGYPMVIGTSRKGFLGRTLALAGEPPVPPKERLLGTAATVTAAILGGAHIVRVHDVAEMVRIAQVSDKIAAHCR